MRLRTAIEDRHDHHHVPGGPEVSFERRPGHLPRGPHPGPVHTAGYRVAEDGPAHHPACSPELDFVGTLEIALKLVPGAKRVYVVSGVHEVDRKIEDQARRDFKKWEDKLEFRYLSDIPWRRCLTAVSSAPPGTIVLLLVFTDVTGRNYTPQEVGERLSQVSTAPVFGLLRYPAGIGHRRGLSAQFRADGTKAGQLALDILRGTQSRRISRSVLDVPPVPMFDWRQLRRWNLKRGSFAQGKHRPKQGTHALGLQVLHHRRLGLFLAETALIIVLVVQRRRKSGRGSLRQKTKSWINSSTSAWT